MRILWRHPEGWLDRRIEEHAVGVEMEDEGAELAPIQNVPSGAR
jgi:hypothetical protein